MKPLLLWTAKTLAVLSALTLAGFYVWTTQKKATDDHTIDLNLQAEVQEFEGFINYGSPIKTEGTDALGRPTTIILGTKSIPQPVFSTRKAAPPTPPPPPSPEVDPQVQQRVNWLLGSLLDPPPPHPPGRRFMSGSKSALIEIPTRRFSFSEYFQKAK